jgi:hypothetical protein
MSAPVISSCPETRCTKSYPLHAVRYFLVPRLSSLVSAMATMVCHLRLQVEPVLGDLSILVLLIPAEVGLL